MVIFYERDSDAKGFLNSRSSSLEFVGKGRDFLLTQLSQKGIAEDVVLEKRAKTLTTLDERWRTFPKSYVSMADLSEKDDLTVKSKSGEGGIKKIVDSRKSDEFDIVSSEAMNGADIGSLDTVNVQLDPREIFLRSVIKRRRWKTCESGSFWRG